MDCNSLNNARASEKREVLRRKFGRYLHCTLKKQLLRAELMFEKRVTSKAAPSIFYLRTHGYCDFAQAIFSDVIQNSLGDSETHTCWVDS